MSRVTGRTGALPSISKNRTVRFEGAIWSFSRVAARAAKKNQDKLSAKWDSQDRLSPAAGQQRGITLDTGLMTECSMLFSVLRGFCSVRNRQRGVLHVARRTLL